MTDPTATDPTALAARFETHRPHLRAVAGRLLGSASDADDAVQETWVRLARSDVRGVENLGGWLTTVVARVSLSMLTARGRRPAPLATAASPEPDVVDDGPGPEDEAVVADAVGLALLVVLDTLTPSERLAFVLHDLFAMPFDQIAPVLDRTPVAARQLASRARRRVRGASPDAAGDALDAADAARRREVVDAFLAASREGDFAALLAVLDPEVVLRADDAAVAGAAARRGAPGLAPEVRGADAVARVFSGRAAAAVPALVDGHPGAAYAPGGRPYSVFRFTLAGDRVAAVEIVADPAHLEALTVVLRRRRG